MGIKHVRAPVWQLTCFWAFNCMLRSNYAWLAWHGAAEMISMSSGISLALICQHCHRCLQTDVVSACASLGERNETLMQAAALHTCKNIQLFSPQDLVCFSWSSQCFPCYSLPNSLSIPGHIKLSLQLAEAEMLLAITVSELRNEQSASPHIYIYME